MTRDEIIRMAREAGCTVNEASSWARTLERFAARVAKHTLANIDPSSFMSWQEGYAAGAAAEREACAKVSDERMGPHNSVSTAIRARGNT